MAGGTIFAGLFGEPYDMKDNHTRLGVAAILLVSTIVIFLIPDPFWGLIYSQMFLSIQLPITVVTQVYLTSSKKVMGVHKNSLLNKAVLILIAVVLAILNLMLLVSFLR
jgi:manganese transport protein